MERFNSYKPNRIMRIVRALPLAALIVIFIFFCIGVDSISETTSSKRLESMRTAIKRSLSECYSLEGEYPETLEHLSEHYGLVLDEETFLYDYDYFGSNLYPDVTVLLKKSKGGDE